MAKQIIGCFSPKIRKSTKLLCCCFVVSLVLSLNLSSFGISKPDLDGNKIAKGKCSARKIT